MELSSSQVKKIFYDLWFIFVQNMSDVWSSMEGWFNILSQTINTADQSECSQANSDQSQKGKSMSHSDQSQFSQSNNGQSYAKRSDGENSAELQKPADERGIS